MTAMLTAEDPLPLRPSRALVCGVTGSGKSTFAARLGAALDLRYTEIDSLYHGPQWTPRPQFLGEVDRVIAEPRWVTEWQYRIARERLLDRADLLVWLDYPFRVSLGRLLRRTVRRRLRREVLWHGNVEPPLHSFFTDPDANIVRWGLSTKDKYRVLVPKVEGDRPELTIVRLESPHVAERWLQRIGRGELLP